jgi:cytochrome b561
MTINTKRFITVIFAAIALLIVGLLIEELLSIRSGSLFGHTQTGHIVGWIGLAVIFSVFIYSVKKRFGRKAGWPKAWFVVHQVAGVLGPLLILVHAGSHFHALVPLLTLIVMVIVVVSGVIGVVVHRKALSLLNSTRKELVSLGLSQADIEDRLYGLVSGEKTFRVWQIIHVPMVMLFLALLGSHILGALYFGGL